MWMIVFLVFCRKFVNRNIQVLGYKGEAIANRPRDPDPPDMLIIKTVKYRKFLSFLISCFLVLFNYKLIIALNFSALSILFKRFDAIKN